MDSFLSHFRSFALSFRKNLSLSISFSQNTIFSDVFLKCSKCVFAMDHFQLFGVFSTQKNASQLSDRLTGISLFVALIFLIPLFLTQFTDTNADSSFLYVFFSLPIPFIFFCSAIVASAVAVAILLRYSLLNFVSFVNSNKLSIVLNMCYSWSQYTMHKTLEQFLKIFKYLRDENTSIRTL